MFKQLCMDDCFITQYHIYFDLPGVQVRERPTRARKRCGSSRCWPLRGRSPFHIMRKTVFSWLLQGFSLFFKSFPSVFERISLVSPCVFAFFFIAIHCFLPLFRAESWSAGLQRGSRPHDPPFPSCPRWGRRARWGPV